MAYRRTRRYGRRTRRPSIRPRRRRPITRYRRAGRRTRARLPRPRTAGGNFIRYNRRAYAHPVVSKVWTQVAFNNTVGTGSPSTPELSLFDPSSINNFGLFSTGQPFLCPNWGAYVSCFREYRVNWVRVTIQPQTYQGAGFHSQTPVGGRWYHSPWYDASYPSSASSHLDEDNVTMFEFTQEKPCFSFFLKPRLQAPVAIESRFIPIPSYAYTSVRNRWLSTIDPAQCWGSLDHWCLPVGVNFQMSLTASVSFRKQK